MEQVGQSQAGSGGSSESFQRAFFSTTGPCEVCSSPLRALRVGITQSNRSLPAATASTISPGVPTPMR